MEVWWRLRSGVSYRTELAGMRALRHAQGVSTTQGTASADQVAAMAAMWAAPEAAVSFFASPS
jgi:hypothetical protein